MTPSHQGDITKHFALFIEQCPAALAMFDKEMRYVLANQKWISDHGLEGIDVIGRYHYELFPEIPDRWKQVHLRCLAGASEKCEEDSFIKKDHHIAWMKWQVYPWHQDNGEIGGIIIMTENITKFKESELIFRDLVEQSKVGVFIFQDYKLVYANSRFAEIFGYELQEMIGNFSPDDLVIPEDLEILIRNRQLREEGNLNNVQYELRARRKNGELIWVESHGNETVFQGAKAIIGTCLDTTKKKKAENELFQSHREVLKLNRLYQFISEINESIIKAQSESQLFKDACRIAVETGKFRMAWIGIFDEKNDKVVPYTWYGHEDGYLERARIIGSDKAARGRGPTGLALRTRKYQYSNDTATDERMLPWKEEALKRNYYSSFCIPIIINGEVAALYTLYFTESNFFNDTEIQLLLKVADNLSFALDKIRLRELQSRSQEKLKESEDKFRNLVEQSPLGVYIHLDGQFKYINPGLKKICGFSQEEFNRTDITKFIHETDSAQAVVSHLKEKGFNEWHDYTLRFKRKDGKYIYIELRNSMILYEGKFATLGTVLDVTERIEEAKHIEKAVTKAQEEERKQMGMELHDNVQQILVGSILTLDFARSSKDKPEVVDSILVKLEGYLRDAISELRRLSHQLAPSIEAEGSLKEKMADLVSTMNTHGGMKVSMSIPAFKPAIRKDIQLALYRIFQEQFTNILKYSKAKNVLIQIEKKQGDLRMLVKDDGIGFNLSKRRNGIGLENIRRRANVLDGHVNIITAPGKGCQVIVEIPYIKKN